MMFIKGGNVNLIVIHPFGRAGSVLFQSLLDGHSNIFTFPHFGPIFSKMREDITLNGTNQFDDEVLKFIRNHPEIFDTSKGYFGKEVFAVSGSFGDKFDEHIRTDITIFRKNTISLKNQLFAGKTKITKKEFFELICFSFFSARGGDINQVRYIAYHPHKLDEMDELLNYYPNLFFVGMFRDPISCWNSWKKVISKRSRIKEKKISKPWAFYYALNHIQNVYRLSEFEHKLQNKIYIDLIRLHNLNSKAMELVSDWLDIPFNEKLLSSTFCDKRWSGNSAAGKISVGLDENKKDQVDGLKISEAKEYSSLVNGSYSYLNYYGDHKTQIASSTLSIFELLKYFFVERISYMWHTMSIGGFFFNLPSHISKSIFSIKARQNVNEELLLVNRQLACRERSGEFL